jgi:hypothetical protein
LLDCSERSNHAADRMSDEDHILQFESLAYFQHVLRIAIEVGVPFLVIRVEIRFSCANIIKHKYPILVFESRCDKPPHVLVASEAMSKHHRFGSLAPGFYIVARNYVASHECSIFMFLLS